MFNFFRNGRIIFITQQKPSNFFLLCYTLYFHRPSRCLICDGDASSRQVFGILLLTNSLSYSHKYKQHSGGD